MAYEVITLNLIPSGEVPVIHAAQYDKARPLMFALKLGDDDFDPSTYDMELQIRKVDNNIVTAAPASMSNNVVTFNSTEQMTACSGTNLGEIQITKGDLDIATLHFYLVVQRDVLAGGLTSQSEIHDLEEQIAVLVHEVIGDEYYTAEQVDEKIADIPTFDPDNYYDKTQLYTKTETNGLLSQKANTSSLAAVALSGSYNDLLNKPTIPDVSDYYKKSETYSQNEVNTLLSSKSDTSSLSAVATSGSYNDLLNKPTIPAAQVQSDWSQSDNTKVDYIKNKPTIPAAQVQSDWSQSDNTKVDYIKNKPTIPTNAELLPIESGSATNTKDYIDSKTTLTDGTVTWNTTNVDGDVSKKVWYQYGRIVIAHLEFTPLSGKIANGNVICSGLPVPTVPYYTSFGGNSQQLTVNSSGELVYWYPSDTATLRRTDITLVYTK